MLTNIKIKFKKSGGVQKGILTKKGGIKNPPVKYLFLPNTMLNSEAGKTKNTVRTFKYFYQTLC